MEGGVHHPRRNIVADMRSHTRATRSAGNFDPVTICHTSQLGVGLMNFENIFGMPDRVVSAPSLSPYVVLAQNPARC